MKRNKVLVGSVAAALCVGLMALPAAVASCDGSAPGVKTGLVTVIQDAVEPGITVESPDLDVTITRTSGDGTFCE